MIGLKRDKNPAGQTLNPITSYLTPGAHDKVG